MFNFWKKEPSPKALEDVQSVDWTKNIKRNKKIGQEVEQLSFLYRSESNNDTKREAAMVVKNDIKDYLVSYAFGICILAENWIISSW